MVAGGNSTVPAPPPSSTSTDALTAVEFLSRPLVTSAVILLASVSQGICSQLSSHVLTVAGIRTRNALQVTSVFGILSKL